MNQNTIISVIVPQISDATYDLTLPENKDKDVIVVLTTTEPVESVIAQDGSKVTGTNLQKKTVVKITLGEKKSRVSELQKNIDDNIAENIVLQKEIDDLNIELPNLQSAVDQALVGWKPVEVGSAEEIII